LWHQGQYHGRLASPETTGDFAQKKTVHAQERESPEIQAQRQEWLKKQPTLDPRRLFFLDETNANTRMHRLYGRGPIGERVLDTIPYRHYESTTLLSVIGLQGVVASLVYEGGTDVPALEAFVEGQLAKVLHPGDILVMDNLASHKSATIQQMLADIGVDVKLLPPYSPDFNPIENMFSKMKAYLKKIMQTASDPLWKLVGDALATITTIDIAGFFRHCGYEPV
jgi:transposase